MVASNKPMFTEEEIIQKCKKLVRVYENKTWYDTEESGLIIGEMTLTPQVVEGLLKEAMRFARK